MPCTSRSPWEAMRSADRNKEEMLALDITPEEVHRRQLRAAQLRAAVQALRADGVVVLNQVVDLGHLEVLHDKMLEDLAALQARQDAPYNWNKGNIQQDPPPFPPYLFRDILLNDLAVAVSRAVLGAGLTNGFYSGNTALPGKERQPVHADSGQLWPDLAAAHPACQLVVNIPVVDMTPQNGSTEIWPGTHLDTTIVAGGDIKVPAALVEQRRSVVPPFQPVVRRGSILIRDMRLWHAGMPNLTAQPRPMIATTHSARWLRLGKPLLFPKGTEALFQGSDLTTHVQFVGGPIDYIRQPQAYEYEQ